MSILLGGLCSPSRAGGVGKANGRTSAITGNNSTQGPQAKRRVLIVENHPLVRRGLTALIDQEPDLTVCAAAATRYEALQAIASFRPDLVITDLFLGDGMYMVSKIRSAQEDLPVLVLTMHDAAEYARRAFHDGASGYITKQELGEELLVAMRRVLAGETYVSAKVKPGLDAA